MSAVPAANDAVSAELVRSVDIPLLVSIVAWLDEAGFKGVAGTLKEHAAPILGDAGGLTLEQEAKGLVLCALPASSIAASGSSPGAAHGTGSHDHGAPAPLERSGSVASLQGWLPASRAGRPRERAPAQRRARSRSCSPSCDIPAAKRRRRNPSPPAASSKKLAEPSAPATPPQRPPQPLPCKDFARGSCKFGFACRFAHDYDWQAQPTESPRPQQQARPSARPDDPNLPRNASRLLASRVALGAALRKPWRRQ